MVDKVSMINSALALCGGEAISTIPSTINDTSVPPRTRWALRLWDQNYDATLSLWPWNDARARYAVPKHGVAPAFGYAAQYELDPKVLKVFAVQNCGRPWTREGRYVLHDGGDTLNIRTIDRVQPEMLNGATADLVSARLAHRVAVALSDSAAKQELLKKNLREQLTESLLTDNWEGSSEAMLQSGWWQAATTSYSPELEAIGEPKYGWLEDV